MMKITLQIGGREMTFSESELIEILENHFANQKETHEQKEHKTMQKPTEGKCFEVNPKAINQNLFSEKRKDSKQEQTRQIILEAFTKLSQELEKYGRPFKTMIPEKTWSSKTVKELTETANNLGDHMADWVEQALEWAQRIANGDTWEAVCNEADTENWYRLVIWKNGYTRLVGGARKDNDSSPASGVCDYKYSSNNRLSETVPLVVLY